MMATGIYFAVEIFKHTKGGHSVDRLTEEQFGIKLHATLAPFVARIDATERRLEALRENSAAEAKQDQIKVYERITALEHSLSKELHDVARSIGEISGQLKAMTNSSKH